MNLRQMRTMNKMMSSHRHQTVVLLFTIPSFRIWMGHALLAPEFVWCLSSIGETIRRGTGIRPRRWCCRRGRWGSRDRSVYGGGEGGGLVFFGALTVVLSKGAFGGGGGIIEGSLALAEALA
ncbi:hypothetical protein Syun_029183 [Stephania yunnanensis]|uniref:Uncharacterized protein n=1 Tax=Stephania yunnanensis TaxID=152371 RepID=A0AAP0HH34_9MAGN